MVKKTLEQRRAENKKYRNKKKAMGYIMTSFLMPEVIHEDVKQYVRSKTQEFEASRK